MSDLSVPVGMVEVTVVPRSDVDAAFKGGVVVPVGMRLLDYIRSEEWIVLKTSNKTVLLNLDAVESLILEE